jgi:hypothetical protein
MAILKWRPMVLMLLLAQLGQAQIVGEYQVKAAFLLNFARFVEWPPTNFSSPTDPIDICVLGPDPFGEALDDIVKDKVISGRHLQVRRLHEVSQSNGCEVVFVNAIEARSKPQHSKELTWGILTISDGKDFSRDGGIVTLVMQQNRIGFEINLDAADHSGLKISSKLLSLATIVHEEPGMRN